MLLRTVSLIIVGAGLAINGHSQSFITNGLVAYYPFNGDVSDATGNGHDGQQTNTFPTLDRFGNPSGALFFPGDYPTRVSWVEIPWSSQFSNHTWTIAAWVNIQRFQSFNRILDNGGDDNSGIPGYSLTYSQKTNNGRFFFILGAGWGGGGDYIYGTTMIQSNTWYSVVGTYDGTNAAIYVNGSLDVGAAKNWVLSSKKPIEIGRFQGNIGYPHYTSLYTGAMDDTRIYSRSLSPSEVRQLYIVESSSECILHRASATATLNNGFVVGATITDFGCGYTNTPPVLILGGGGTGATAAAVVSNGVVVNISITSAGIGYTSTPGIYIYSPVGLQIGLKKAVKPSFSDLFVGTNYQLQVSSGLNTWTNQGSPFPATFPSMDYPQYFDVDDWSQLFFRLLITP